MRNFDLETLSHDPIHGYIPFTSAVHLPSGEIAEQQIIDHPWVQRLRQIHQLQTAWYVYPTAEHSRFEHVLGSMHLATRMIENLYPSLKQQCPDVPSKAYVESLLRMAALLHDVGHGPYGHFFDEFFLKGFGLTHETLGAAIICQELGPLLQRIRRNPSGELQAHETLDPQQIAFLITRPTQENPGEQPRWLEWLRALFCGVYTVDNMDFVLRDSYMAGFSTKAFDIDRILHYTFFSTQGLTIHQRGLPALIRFLEVRAELFRSLYFHRVIRAIDLQLADLFDRSKGYLLPGSPVEYLDDYQLFTEWSLIVDVSRWPKSEDPQLREIGNQWASFLRREMVWRMACERTLFFRASDAERSSIFAQPAFVEQQLRELLPPQLHAIPFKVDLARHLHRPGTAGPTRGLNFVYQPGSDAIGPLQQHELYRQLPTSYRICRIYTQTPEHDVEFGKALDALIAPGGQDDLTNM